MPIRGNLQLSELRRKDGGGRTLTECDHPASQNKAEELRAAVVALGIPRADSPTANCVTLSIGVAVMQPNGENAPEALIAAADAALYEAKRNGRNRVTASPSA